MNMTENTVDPKCRWPKRKQLAFAKAHGIATAERLFRDLEPTDRRRVSAPIFARFAQEQAMADLFLNVPGRVAICVTEYGGDAAHMRANELFYGATP